MAPHRPETSTETGRIAMPRPDSTPGRLVLGVGGLAAASALVTAIVTPSAPVVPAMTIVHAPESPSRTVTVQRPVQYVQLAPGQSVPPGARVIDAKAPKPITIVTRVPAPAQQTVVVRTTQSGRVLP